MRTREHAGSGWFLNLLILAAAMGSIGLACYPTVANLINQMRQDDTMVVYNEVVQKADTSSLDAMWDDAVAFNDSLARQDSLFQLSESEQAEYETLLDVDDSGLMGYIDIPAQDIHLSIYHGTDDEVLDTAAGHLEGSSLPTDGDSVHCVITGHTGLPNLDLFTDIDQMAVGDIFTVTVLNRVLTYEVDRIDVILPEELDVLAITDGQNYCTLVTCTPYGVNDHRLLVRGSLQDVTMTGTTEETVTSEVVQQRTAVRIWLAVVLVVIAAMMAFLIWLIFGHPMRGGSRRQRWMHRKIRISRGERPRRSRRHIEPDESHEFEETDELDAVGGFCEYDEEAYGSYRDNAECDPGDRYESEEEYLDEDDPEVYDAPDGDDWNDRAVRRDHTSGRYNRYNTRHSYNNGGEEEFYDEAITNKGRYLDTHSPDGDIGFYDVDDGCYGSDAADWD